MNDTRAEIIKLICKAQFMSDAAKGIYYSEMDSDSCYKEKADCIHKAVCLCKKNKVGILADVHKGTDQNGCSCLIVYFTIKNCNYGKATKQVSFHSFDSRLDKFISDCNQQHWLQKGNSRRNCEFLEMEISGKA